MAERETPRRRVGFLGPVGTFTEQALLSQTDLASEELVPFETIAAVLDATAAGELDLGFVPIENSIEGSVNASQDALMFAHDLLIQREVVLDVELCLLAPPGTRLDDVRRILSFPHATGQCQEFLRATLPHAVISAANSTAESARLVGVANEHDVAAIAPVLAGKLYGLDVLATDIADHDGNQTRFLLVATQGVPHRTGHDKTTVVVYQRKNVPGSLLAILQEFAARSIDLSRLESRPTKKGGLGDYCFLIEFDGHIADELVADCLRTLHAKQGSVKFLGSYPAAGAHGARARREAAKSWQQADRWVQQLRDQIG